MHSACTLVTALYNIGRDKLTGKNAHRSFTKYLDWFKHLLAINAPMVIFIPEELHSYVTQYRAPEYTTKIVIRKFEELKAYKYLSDIQAAIDRMRREPDGNGKIPSYFNECPEFITAKYETIIYSKFDFLYEVAQENPYNTNYFLWLDAGTFYQPAPFNTTLPWPDPYKIAVLGNRFLLSNYNFNADDMTPLNDKRTYLRQNRNEICAYILGGTKIAIERVYEQFWSEVNNALQLGVINNEQHILQLMALEEPDYYYLWYRTRYQYPKLSAPLRDRMIPAELAQGTFMGEHYPINETIKLLTIATKEILKSSYQRWESTASHYGYNYEILGQTETWKGYGTKIVLYHARLQSVEEPYTVLTDCTDLFFCGSSQELYEKFINLGEDIIIGGELEMYYPGTKHTLDTVKAYFNAIKKSPQAFPNSGFIMGKTENLRRLMELHLEYSDDQAACFDTMYEKALPLTIDYDTALIGNIPNYKERTNLAAEYFEYDTATKRYKNINSGETPVALHFPGKNWHIMQEFYTISQPDVAVSESSPPSTGWILVGALILLIIIILVAYLGYNNYN